MQMNFVVKKRTNKLTEKKARKMILFYCVFAFKKKPVVGRFIFFFHN